MDDFFKFPISVSNCKQMALTPQVVEDWIKENVCADKDKSTSKKDIWSSFPAGLPFISIEERANFFLDLP